MLEGEEKCEEIFPFAEGSGLEVFPFAEGSEELR